MRISVLKHTVSSAALVLAFLLQSGVARAETDTFGLGTGRDGALSVTSTTGQVTNTYAQVTAAVQAGATSITIGPGDGAAKTFVPGQVVMIFQQRGGFVAAPASGSATAITLGKATRTGRYELARVAAANASTVTLTHGTVNAYDANDTQILSVPEYTTVTITTNARLVAKPWNGTTGGILAFLASGALVNSGTLDAGAAGFRGGVVVAGDANIGCAALDGTPGVGGPAAGGAHKGESLDPGAYSAAATYVNGIPRHFGRGNVANGGGGGNCFNAGGGGGGHGGVGGGGGNTNGNFDTGARTAGGLGGAPVSYDPASSLTFGGAGGAGHDDDNVGGAGGAGGGIVWLRATSLAGAGTIGAAGGVGASGREAPGNPLWTDGGGGGGAGGAVFAWLAGTAACGGVDVRGGRGGDADPVTGARNYGPGGGGAGGRVRIASSGGTCAANVAGGVRGTTSIGPFGATTGGAGESVAGPVFAQTACNVSTGSCGGCVNDAFCAAPTPSCNTAPGPSRWTCGVQTTTPAPYGADPAGGAVCAAAAQPTQGTSSGCVNGLCDTSDGKCGYANGTPCSAGAECRANLCAPDGKCGLPVGADCTSDVSCRSNACGLGRCGIDTDGDGITDDQEIALGTNPQDPDSDRDGIPDGVELRPNGGGPGQRIDSDGDGTLDALDTDSDNDTLLDSVEGNGAFPVDSDGDRIADYRDADDDNDRIPTRQEVTDATRVGVSDDIDGDSRKNWRDNDADGDAILDGDEAVDANADGIPDYLQRAGAAAVSVSLEGGGIGCASTPGGAPGNGWLGAVLGLVGVAAVRGRRRR